MPKIDIATGVSLFYEDVGDGFPVVAVHGWLGTGRKDLGAVIDWLAAGYRVIAPSLRGYGQSRPPQRDFPNDFYDRDADDVLALMDALAIETAHLIGYSDGGEVALIAAGKHPGRFASVTTVGSVGYFGTDMRPIVQRNAPATFLINEPDTMALHGIENARAFVAGWIRAIVHMIDRGGDISLSLAPNITCPVLLLLGDQDTLNPAAYAQRLVDAAPNARLEVFKDTGHGVHQERLIDFQRVVGPHLRTNTPR